MSSDDALSAYVPVHAATALQGLEALGSGGIDELAQRASVELVHEVRTSLRRLRAMLRTAPASFTGNPTADGDLRFVARTLSEVRDADVMTESLVEELDAPPSARADETVRTHLVSALAGRRLAGIEHVHRRREDERWSRALEQLRAWQQDPPRLHESDPARLLEDLRVGVRTTIHQAGTDTNALHSARRAAKRWRYTAEMLLPALGQAQAHYDAATEVHQRLGELQDAVVADQFLAEHLYRESTVGAPVTALGQLRQSAQQRITEAVRDAPQLL